MQKLVVVASLICVLLVGCTPGVTPLPVTPAPIAPAPTKSVSAPENVTWVSPGKVWVGNFHLGARAEWSVVVHNGEDEPRNFRVAYKLPARTDEGYLKAPTDVVQDWVIVADSSFILAPKETRETLVALVMPEGISESEARFLEFTPKGQAYLTTQVQAYWGRYLDGYLRQDPGRPEVMRAKAADNWNAALEKYIKGTPEIDLLVYLNEKGSLSYQLLLRDRLGDEDLVKEFVAKKFLVEGNLLTDKWEFLVDVLDVSQGGSDEVETGGRVQVSMAVKWLVTMRG